MKLMRGARIFREPAFRRPWAVAGRLVVGLIVLWRIGIGPGAPASENWPAWRGDGSGVSDETHLPSVWSESQNVLWRTALPGEGNSSPIVWKNRLFVTASLEEGARRLVLCLDAERGAILWQSELRPEGKTTFYAKTGYASPTAVTDGRRVFVFFDSPGLAALDMQGNVLWTVPLGPFKSPYNMGSSPVLYKDTVILCCDHHGQAFLVALGQADGRQRWRTPRPASGFSHFGTPLLIRVGGRPQLVVNGEPVIAYDPDTGRELWSCRGMRECVAPSPVFGDGLVYASSGRIGPVIAIDPSGRGDVTETHVRWHLTDVGPYVPTPLVYHHLLVPGDNGKLAFFDAAGKPVLEDRVRDHFTSSPVAGDGKIYWCSERGKTYVLDAAGLTAEKRAVRVVAVNQLHGAILATPAIANRRIFLRTGEALYGLAESGQAALAKVTEAPPAPLAPPATPLAELKARYESHQAVWQNEPEARIRLELLESIARLDDPDVVPFLLHTAQKEPHWDICEEAAKSLGRKDQAAVDSLLVLVPDSRPFIRTIAISELGRLKVAKAAPGILLAAVRDKQPLVRSTSLQALARIGGADDADRPQIIAAMLAALDDTRHEEAVVRESALVGLAALAGQVTVRRPDVVRALARVAEDRNPRLARKAQELLHSVYQEPAK